MLCYVMLYNTAYAMLCYLTHVMLCYITHVMPCYITHVMFCYITNDMFSYLLFNTQCHCSLCTKSLIAVLKDAKQLSQENGGGPFS